MELQDVWRKTNSHQGIEIFITMRQKMFLESFCFIGVWTGFSQGLPRTCAEIKHDQRNVHYSACRK